MVDIEWGRAKRATKGVPRYSLSARGTNGTARVVATWDGLTPNSPPIAPGRVTITRERRDGERVDRGVTSPVLADAQPILTTMAQGIPGITADLDGLDPMDEARELARRLPPGPRGFPTYYGHLLKLATLVEQIEPHRPIQALVELTGKPESTLHLHLRKARAASS